jgi:uncharacterized damage-inducible protein DinB
MYEHELTLFDFNLHMVKGLTRDLREDQLDHRIQHLGHSPRWILAHLAVATDYALKCCGVAPALPESWHNSYGFKSSDADAAAPRPTKAELLAAIDAGHARVRQAVAALKPGQLAHAHPLEQLKSTPLQTFEHVLGHLLTTHFAYHLGQLSAWRRQMGFPALF